MQHTYVDQEAQATGRVLGINFSSDADILIALFNGLPSSALFSLRQHTGIAAIKFLELIGFSRSKWDQIGSRNLSIVDSDRIVRIAGVYAHALEVFEDAKLVDEWLLKPLDGHHQGWIRKTPAQLCSFERGAKYLHDMLGNIEAGNFA